MPHRVNTSRQSPADPRGSARPGYPRGFSPLRSVVHSVHGEKVPSAVREQQGQSGRIVPRVGTSELRGRIKDTLRSAIHCVPSPGVTRERLADLLGTTAGEVSKKAAPEDPRHVAAHELPAVAEVLGDDILHLVAEAAGGVFLRLEPVDAPDPMDCLCELLLEAGDAAGTLAHELRAARRSPENGLTTDQRHRIEDAGHATLRAYQRVLLALEQSR